MLSIFGLMGRKIEGSLYSLYIVELYIYVSLLLGTKWTYHNNKTYNELSVCKNKLYRKAYLEKKVKSLNILY